MVLCCLMESKSAFRGPRGPPVRCALMASTRPPRVLGDGGAADSFGEGPLAEQSFYSPRLISRWLREWDWLESMAENASTSAHLLSPDCRHSDHSCSDGQPVGIKNIRNHTDRMRYADVRADLIVAAQQLPAYSLESQVVAAWMTGDYPSLDEMMRLKVKARKHDVLQAHRAAVRMMAVSLGWEEEKGS